MAALGCASSKLNLRVTELSSWLFNLLHITNQVLDELLMLMDVNQSGAPCGVLRVENLGVTYPGGATALRSANVEFRRGEFTVLLGLSGAGKSTLLRTLSHLTMPTSGRVVSSSLGPLDTEEVLRRHRRKTAMVFQHHQLIGRKTALANVMTGRLGYRSSLGSLLPPSRAELRLGLRCLERVGMLEKAMSRADNLSGGQQQRVGIARALAQQPEMVLADEPVASLDPATSEKVLTLLQTVCREDDITAVVSLHQLEYARRFADRIIGLAHAQIVFDGAPDELDESALDLIYGGMNGRTDPVPVAIATSPQSAMFIPSLEISR